MVKIDPVSSAMYKNIAGLRRALLNDPGIPAEVLRQALRHALDACEELLQGFDRAVLELTRIYERGESS